MTEEHNEDQGGKLEVELGAFDEESCQCAVNVRGGYGESDQHHHPRFAILYFVSCAGEKGHATIEKDDTGEHKENDFGA